MKIENPTTHFRPAAAASGSVPGARPRQVLSVETVIEALQSFSGAELDRVSDAIALRQRAGSESGTNERSEAVLHRYLASAINRKLASRKSSAVAPYEVFKRASSTHYATFRRFHAAVQSLVDEAFARRSPSHADRAFAFNTIAVLVVHRAAKIENVPLSMPLVCNLYEQVRGIFDMSFPAYLPSGIAWKVLSAPSNTDDIQVSLDL